MSGKHEDCRGATSVVSHVSVCADVGANTTQQSQALGPCLQVLERRHRRPRTARPDAIEKPVETVTLTAQLVENGGSNGRKDNHHLQAHACRSPVASR